MNENTGRSTGGDDAKNAVRREPMGQTCGKCGATRVDQQVLLGLEPTPEEYVENMVAVFREVGGCSGETGTCWLNIGDSYAGIKGPSRFELPVRIRRSVRTDERVMALRADEHRRQESAA